MAGNHPKIEAWDMALHRAICTVDRMMELRFGGSFTLRPNRPAHGTTSNPQMDGAFNIGLVFTPGYNSRLGRGYWLDLEVGSRTTPAPHDYELWLCTCKELLEVELNKELPGRGLHFELDSGRYKLLGDFSLGTI